MGNWIRVQQGESLEAIARLHHLTMQRLEELNRAKKFDLAAADGKPSSPSLKPGMRDPDSLVVGEKLRVAAPAPTEQAVAAPKPAATPATPAVKPLSDQALTEKLQAQVAQANHVAEDDKSINDPLRLLAQQDPIAYAQQVVGAKYGQDAKSTRQLADCAQRLRVDDTTRQVKALMEPADGKAAKPLAAIKLLDKAMDGPGVTTADQRSELWKKAGEPYFTKAFFTKQLHDAAYKARYGKPEVAVGDWMLAFSKNAPAEASRELLDVFVKHDFDDDLGPKLNLVLDMRDKTNPALFKGLSSLVQQGAEIPGDSRADKVATWLLGPSGGPSITRLQSLGPLAVRAAIADGNGSRLATALIDGAKKQPVLADLREQLLDQTAQGGDDLRARAATARKDWQDAMPKNLRWALDYFVDGSDPKAVTHAVELYRASNPKEANAMDRAAQKTSQVTANVYAFVKDSAGLDIGKDPATAGERKLATALSGIDGDKALLQGLQNSADVERLLLKQSGYGEQPLEALPVGASGLYEHSQQAFAVRNTKNVLQQALQEVTKMQVRRLLDVGAAGNAHLQESVFSYLKKVGPLYGVSAADSGKLVDQAAALARRGSDATQAARPEYVDDLAKFNKALSARQVGGTFGNLLKVVNVATFATNIISWKKDAPSVAPLPPNVMVLGNVMLGARDAGSLVAKIPGVSEVLGDGPLLGKVDALLKGLGDKTGFAKFTGTVGMGALSLAGFEYMIKDGRDGDIPLAVSDAALSLGAGGAAAFTVLGAETAPVWLNPVGITLLGLGVLGRVSIKQYESVSKSNAMEPSKNPQLRDFLQQLGFGKDTATHLLDQTHHGVSPMIALDAWAQMRGLSRSQLFDYLKSLPESDLKTVVKAAHLVTDSNEDALVGTQGPPQDAFSPDALRRLSAAIDTASVKPPAGTKTVNYPLDPMAAGNAYSSDASKVLQSFNQIAEGYKYDLLAVTDGDTRLEAENPRLVKSLALDQLFKLNPQYNRALLDGNPNTPRGPGVQGLDPDAVKVGTRLNVGVGTEPPMS